MHAFYHCDRREIKECDSYIRHILDQMTTYAATMAQRHLNGRIPRLPCENLNERKVNSFVSTFFYFIVTENDEEFIVDTEVGTCKCQFYQTMWPPCIHLLSIFRRYMYPYSELILY